MEKFEKFTSELGVNKSNQSEKEIANTMRAKLRQLFAFFQSKDQEIVDVEKSAAHVSPETIEKIKEEINLDEELGTINKEAEALVGEALLTEFSEEKEKETYSEKVFLPFLKVVAKEEDLPGLLAELRAEAEKKLSKRREEISEEMIVDTMKQLLIDRCQKTISLDEKISKKGKGKRPDQETVLNAKVVSLAAGDSSILEQYKAHGYKESYRALFHGYLDLRSSSYGNSYNENRRLNSDAVNLLMSAGYKEHFLQMGQDERRAAVSEYSEELIKALIQNVPVEDDSSVWKLRDVHDELRYILEDRSKGFSREIYEQMVSCGASHHVIQHLNIFQDAISPVDLLDFARRYSCAYPYMLDNLFAGIDKTNWTPEAKMEARRNVLMFHDVTDSNKRYHFMREDMKEFKEIADYITKIDAGIDLPAIREQIELGRLPFFHDFGAGFKKLIESDPQFVMAQAARFNQENLLFHKLPEPLLNDFRQRYIEKLADRGDLDMIIEFEKKGITRNILSKKLYLEIFEKTGYIAGLNSATLIDDEIFAMHKGGFPAHEKNVFTNIDKIQLELPENKSIMEYKKMVEYVGKFFSGRENIDIFDKLGLQPGSVSGKNAEEFERMFNDNVKMVAEYTGKDISNVEDKAEFIEFVKRFGVDVLMLDGVELEAILNEAKLIPQQVWRESAERFRAVINYTRSGEVKDKDKFISELKIVTELFSSRDQDFINQFLKDEGVSTGASISSYDYFEAALRHSSRFASLNEDQQKLLSKVIPGIDRVVQFRDNLNESSSLTEEETRKKLAKNFEFFESEFSKRQSFIYRRTATQGYCGYVETFGLAAPYKNLYSTYKEITITDPAELSVEKKNELKFLFNIEIHKGETSEELITKLQNRVSSMMSEADIKPDSTVSATDVFVKLKLSALQGKKQSEAAGYSAPFLRAECEGHNPGFLESEHKSLADNSSNNHWAMNLWLYIHGAEGDFESEVKENLIKSCNNQEYRDEILESFTKEWLENIETGQRRLNLKLDTICSTVNSFGGAGNLKHVESLSNIITAIKDHAWSGPHTTERTKKEIESMLLEQEKRFDKEKWSQDATSNFYNLSADIISAAPSLYSSFKPLIDRLNGKEMKQFAKELLPLYQAQLVAIQTVENMGKVKYNPKELVSIRNEVTMLAASLEMLPGERQETLSEHKEDLLEDLKMRFQTRFGIKKIPEEMNKESIRTISNCIRYLGNISDRSQEREDLISFYLSLGLNNEWKDFRSGKDIDIDEHLISDRANNVKEMMSKNKDNTLPQELAAISPEDVPEFQRILQAEVSSSMLGSIQTIDYKLLSLKSNIQDLADPDAFPGQVDKELLEICRSGPKATNALLAKVYGETVGKTTTYSPSELLVKDRLANLFNINKWDGPAVKLIQDRVQPMNLIFNLLDKMEKEQLEKQVAELRESLKPSPAVIEIYNRLEEGFKPESGAYALFRDLEYLEGLAVKADNQLSVQEKKDIESYLSPIRVKMADLETLMSRVKEYFNKLSDMAEKNNHPLLKNRLVDVKKAFDSSGGESLIQSYLTSDLNLIIENMRQCLGCLRKEANNDTNLSFGDYNKFFLMSRQGREDGSIADQIVFLSPVKNLANGEQEMNFVLDRLYGDKTPDLLIAHTLAVRKKCLALKERFKDAKLGVIISKAALQSVGIDAEDFIKNFKAKSPESELQFEEELIADIKASGFSDHYVEFSKNNNGRQSGNLSFSGIIING